MQQALDRLRLIHNEEPKLIFILSSVPLPIPVNLLIPRQDITDALRFVRLLEAAKTRGWQPPCSPKPGCIRPSRRNGIPRRRLKNG
jgi:hypothetical protein